MNNSPRVLAVIPARGGSKRLPRKNLLTLAGRPLIAWTIDAAIQSSITSKVIVSSDDEEILQIANRYPSITAITRPPALGADTASTASVLLNALEQEQFYGNHYDILVLLQPTSPLRASTDIDNAFKRYISGHGETVVGVCEVDHPIEWCGTLSASGYFYCPLLDQSKRSQDYEIHYRLNGAVYIVDANYLKTTQKLFTPTIVGSVMPRERSIDIDSAIDLSLCELLLSES